MLTTRFSSALALAVEAHATQRRKGTQIPYITHPLAVAALTLEYGGDEDLAIAALLHDVIEDGGARYAFIIRDNFGKRVARVVQGCTDDIPNVAGVKLPWRERKEKYLAHLNEADTDILLVAGCDKLANARDILTDLNEIGVAVFKRFSASQYETLWFYRQLAEIFTQREAPMAARLATTVAKIEALSARF